MRNLFNRLTLEHQERLEELCEEYPNTVSYIKYELINNLYWSELKYNTAITLVIFLDLYDYSPSTIENLFNND